MQSIPALPFGVPAGDFLLDPVYDTALFSEQHADPFLPVRFCMKVLEVMNSDAAVPWFSWGVDYCRTVGHGLCNSGAQARTRGSGGARCPRTGHIKRGLGDRSAAL